VFVMVFILRFAFYCCFFVSRSDEASRGQHPIRVCEGQRPFNHSCEMGERVPSNSFRILLAVFCVGLPQKPFERVERWLLITGSEEMPGDWQRLETAVSISRRLRRTRLLLAGDSHGLGPFAGASATSISCHEGAGQSRRVGSKEVESRIRPSGEKAMEKTAPAPLLSAGNYSSSRSISQRRTDPSPAAQASLLPSGDTAMGAFSRPRV